MLFKRSRNPRQSRQNRTTMVCGLLVFSSLCGSIPAVSAADTTAGSKSSEATPLAPTSRGLPSPGEIQPQVVAAKVDLMLRKELGLDESTIASQAADAILLRRLSLDLLGRLPGTKQTMDFVASKDAHKIDQAVTEMLHSPSFAQNWAYYWRDTIVARKTEPRVLPFAPVFESYFITALEENRPWNEIARDLITASGDTLEDGRTLLIASQGGQPEDVASEISRIFTGIQIQCAQCHNHPTDRWTREQFHEFAAFFPRVAVRPNMTSERRSLMVSVNDSRFTPPARGNNRFVGTPEHFMSDLQNPEAKGTLMKPKFFITEQAIPIGTPDAVRRGRMAEWLAGPSNPWFAKALVNRLWSELVGRGFYDSVDDIGPDRECRAPRTLDMLAAAFESSGYDYRWLVQTIVSTKAYRTESVSRGDTEPYAGLVRSVAQPLRSDVLLDAMADVLQTDPAALGAAGGGRGMGRGPAMLRVGFSEQFGFDPSSDRDEVGSGVRETLALLNGNASRFNINANRPPLSTILQQQNAPVKIVDKLYLHTLCRLPDADERLTATRYLHDSPDGIPAATEDLFWVLLNSAEFRTRR